MLFFLCLPVSITVFVYVVLVFAWMKYFFECASVCVYAQTGFHLPVSVFQQNAVFTAECL